MAMAMEDAMGRVWTVEVESANVVPTRTGSVSGVFGGVWSGCRSAVASPGQAAGGRGREGEEASHKGHVWGVAGEQLRHNLSGWDVGSLSLFLSSRIGIMDTDMVVITSSLTEFIHSSG